MNRHWVPDALWDVHEEDLSAMARLVYVALTRCVKKGKLTPSFSWLATMTATSASTVKRAMAELESACLVVATHRFGAASWYKLMPVGQWRVRWTGVTQTTVCQATEVTGQANRGHSEPEPGSQWPTLGSSTGRKTGSGAIAVAGSNEDAGEVNRRLAAKARAAVDALVQKTASRMPARG